ncbi:MAG: hypothetical protein IPO30_14140 [Hyphomonadaceae bacterium]|nr:hypothetical protein [Hyphomonadaceae bacterium]MBP9235062.1 hypothetical protein [Hyphomonadaceae bacterium]
MAGNLAVAGRLGVRLMRRPGVAAALMLAGVTAISVAIAPAVAEHGGHFMARAEANHRSALEEILAQPLCSGSRVTAGQVKGGR